jgi:hypothetical protein
MSVSCIVIEIVCKDVKRDKEAVGSFKYCFIEYAISKNVITFPPDNYRNKLKITTSSFVSGYRFQNIPKLFVVTGPNPFCC